MGLACGAAGVAYALLRAGAPIDADRWARAALALARRRGAFVMPGFPRARDGFYLGVPGVWFVRALAARDRRTVRRAIGRFVAACHVSRSSPLELWTGAAGLLAGTALLLHATRDPRLLELGDRLAGLFGSVGDVRARLSHAGLAHGRAGAYRALLLWSRVSGRPLPAWLVPALRRLPPSPPRDGRWCNGAAGLVLLWVDAHEATRDPAFLRAARGEARQVIARRLPYPDLCCGDAGGALALLALDRIDRGRRWRERARSLLLSSIVSPARSPWPHALLKGDAGLLCAALALIHGAPGLPFLDA